MSYPVSVVIPTIPRRKNFLTQRCLPAVFAADPTEVFVVGGEKMNGNEKRNVGGYAATQPYLLFVDDDCELRPECLQVMVAEMARPEISIVYSNFRIEVASGVPWEGYRGDFVAGPPDLWRLQKSNFINTTSLIRRSAFPGFDPALHRFQDWDLWLTMLKAGSKAAYINRNLFTLHQIDVGISLGYSAMEGMLAIHRKHGI